MIGGFFEQDLAAYVIFGVILNFLFSILFGLYLTNNIGMQDMITSKGDKKQPAWMTLMLIIPYAKMIITLYRVAILQIYFLNRGYTHKDFWVYMTNK